MTEYTTYNENESIIIINKNGIDAQAKATVDEHEIVLEVDGDMFVITTDERIGVAFHTSVKSLSPMFTKRRKL